MVGIQAPTNRESLATRISWDGNDVCGRYVVVDQVESAYIFPCDFFPCDYQNIGSTKM